MVSITKSMYFNSLNQPIMNKLSPFIKVLFLTCFMNSFIAFAQPRIYKIEPIQFNAEPIKLQSGFIIPKQDLTALNRTIESTYQNREPLTADTYVYVCLGPDAYAFHIDRNCYELKHCSVQPPTLTTIRESQTAKYIPVDGIHSKRTPCKECFHLR